IEYRVHGDNAAGIPGRGLRERLRERPDAARQRGEILGLLVELVDRLRARDLSTSATRVDAAAAHLSFRHHLPRFRPARALPVGYALLTGAYRRNGGSWRTAAIDVVERRSPYGDVAP
nr:hypothetical protein [Actinomycetota bacterium]